MIAEYKRVPALDKCFAILDLLAKEGRPLGISEIANALAINKSTVFNLVYTLTDLGILENGNKKFRFGTRLFVLGKASGEGSGLINTVHPYLEQISQATNLTAFLGMRSGMDAVIVDKAEAAVDLKISSDVGMRLSLLAGSGGKALLSQLSDQEIDDILSRNELRKFTPYTCTDKKRYRELIMKVREEGIAYDLEEYLEGIIAVAAPLNAPGKDLQAAIWAVGMRKQVSEKELSRFSDLLKESANQINVRFSMV
ncbi:MAG: IclR family transcriptional regulator [Desulfatiglandaceae bacterium]